MPQEYPVQLLQRNQDSTATASNLRTYGSKKSLRTLRDLQNLRSLQSLAKDGVPLGNFSDGISMDHIAAEGQRASKGDLNVGVAGLQGEMLIADRRCSPMFGNGHHDDGQNESVLLAVGDLHRPVNPVLVCFRRFKPFEQQRRGDLRPELFVNAVCGMARVFDS